MIDLLYKLKEKKIFHVGSMIDTVVEKHCLTNPISVRATLRVREMYDTYCIADEEYAHADSAVHKIDFLDIITVDGMKIGDLAAVYGLGPKTSRFKKSKHNK